MDFLAFHVALHTWQQSLHFITQSLRFEIRQFRINVSLIELGAINTEVVTYSMFIPKKIQRQQQKQQEHQNNNYNSSFEKMTK